MSILIAAATELELAPLAARLEGAERRGKSLAGRLCGQEVELLACGIGAANTAWWLGRSLDPARHALAVNTGICGAYVADIPLGAAVEIVRDSYAALGAMSPEGFLPLERLGFPLFETAAGPVWNTLDNPAPTRLPLPKVEGLTLDTASGDAPGIAALRARWPDAQVESMEGAAFFHACLLADVPFAAIRGVSNLVEPRNRAAWRLREAVDAAAAAVLQLLASR